MIISYLCDKINRKYFKDEKKKSKLLSTVGIIFIGIPAIFIGICFALLVIAAIISILLSILF